MAFRRRRRIRRRPRRRTRLGMRRRRIRRPLSQGTRYRCTLVELPTDINLSTSGGVGSFIFKLDNCLEYGRYTDMFDAYRIKGVALTIQPGNYPAGSTTVPGSFYYNIDLNDGIAPLNPASLYATQGCKQFNIFASFLQGKQFRKYIRCRPSTNFYGGVTPGYGVLPTRQNPWIDKTYPDVEHYGFKFAWSSYTSSYPVQIKVTFKYWVEFRGLQPAVVD